MASVMGSPSEDKTLTMKASGPYAIGPRQHEAQISMIVQCVGRHQVRDERVFLSTTELNNSVEDYNWVGVGWMSPPFFTM